MERFSGHRVVGEIAIGTIHVLAEEPGKVSPVPVSDVEAEIARFDRTAKQAAEQLRRLSETSEQRVGVENARIFAVHAMMTEDVDYREEVIRTIRAGKVCAEYAVYMAGRHFSQMFADMEDSYFRARAQDVKDVTDRLLAVLTGRGTVEMPEESYILVAEDLTPGQLMQQKRNRLLGIVTSRGSAYSHTAILCKSMRIPTLTGIVPNPSWEGHRAILDGRLGVLLIDPDTETVRQYLKQMKETAERNEALPESGPAVTKEGRRVLLCANIGNREELQCAIRNGAEGIGLLRTEMLFLDSEELPGEEEQFTFYKEIITAMGGRRVVIRTADIGGDKPADCLPEPPTDNPALGCRGIRLSLLHKDVLRTQLRAVFRAGAGENVAVLYPMITSEKEIREVKEIAESVREELRKEGIDAGNVEQGIMIETPAAAVLSDRMSTYADFFSIGSNDLAQYVLAADRKNSTLYEPGHEAVIRLIAMTVNHAHRAGIPVSVCGELAADHDGINALIAIGTDELSVSPSLLPEVRRTIREYET